MRTRARLIGNLNGGPRAFTARLGFIQRFPDEPPDDGDDEEPEGHYEFVME
jgi:hypothetical protein